MNLPNAGAAIVETVDTPRIPCGPRAA